MATPAENWIGHTQGFLTINAILGRDSRSHLIAEATCKCGYEGCKQVWTGKLFNVVHGYTRSCGALKKHLINRKGKDRPNWKGGKNNKGSLAWANDKLQDLSSDSARGGWLPPITTAEDLQQLYAKSGGRCDICGAHENTLNKSLSIDHNHETQQLRGFLCHGCNTSLGGFKDNPETLRKAIAYLEQQA